MLVLKQWTDEHRTTRKTGSGRWKVMSARDDRHLLHMVVNDPTASSRQLAKRWSTAAGVLISTSSIHRNESRFNLWDHDVRILDRRYVVERCLPECVVDRHSDLTPGVMVWGAISYHGQFNLLRIEGNRKSNSEFQVEALEGGSSKKESSKWARNQKFAHLLDQVGYSIILTIEGLVAIRRGIADGGSMGQSVKGGLDVSRMNDIRHPGSPCSQKTQQEPDEDGYADCGIQLEDVILEHVVSMQTTVSDFFDSIHV
ncbi:transposable element Tc1 transposase [Trichonephila clavipes]|nr:transposable element Tc1 transposase [Trichonephila clavipes]